MDFLQSLAKGKFMKLSPLFAATPDFDGLDEGQLRPSRAAFVLPSLLHSFSHGAVSPKPMAPRATKRLRHSGKPTPRYSVGPLFGLFRRYRSWLHKQYADLAAGSHFYD
ncbi:hypothetical protein [Pollutimonas bauzanensis]|nr:hypothetical protein [Pollutimonas bauzanensis]